MQQNSSKASGALICGIISVAMLLLILILVWFVPIIFWVCTILGIITGIIGTILGVMARKEDPQASGSALAGFILSIIGMALNAILFISCGACALYVLCAGPAAISSWYNGF